MSTAVLERINPFAGESKDAVLAIMRRDREKFTRLVSDPANWNVMTRCAGWETRDLVGHMIDVMEGYFGRWEAAARGELPDPAGLDVMGTTLNDHALDFRSLSREEALERFRADAMKFDGMLDALTPEQWAGGLMVSHPYAGPAPAGAYAAFQIMDYGVHPYDIEYGLGDKLATIPEDSAGVILPWTFIFWQNTVDQAAARGFSATYGIDVDGPVGGKWRCTVADGKFAYEETASFAGCDALFRFPNAAEEVLTHFGRFPGGAAQGDPEVIHKVRHIFFPF